jgi:hypothetical protein
MCACETACRQHLVSGVVLLRALLPTNLFERNHALLDNLKTREPASSAPLNLLVRCCLRTIPPVAALPLITLSCTTRRPAAAASTIFKPCPLPQPPGHGPHGGPEDCQHDTGRQHHWVPHARPPGQRTRRGHGPRHGHGRPWARKHDPRRQHHTLPLAGPSRQGAGHLGRRAWCGPAGRQGSSVKARRAVMRSPPALQRGCVPAAIYATQRALQGVSSLWLHMFSLAGLRSSQPGVLTANGQDRRIDDCLRAGL